MKRLGILVAVLALVPMIASPAAAAEQPPTLSSFQPVFADQTIVGGHREVTVINPFAAALADFSVDLGPAPCECAIVDWVASHGTLEGPVWEIDILDPGGIATLTLDYAAPERFAAAVMRAEPRISSFELRLGLQRLGSFAIA